MPLAEPPSPTPGLEIRGVVKSYGANRVLHGIDLTVASGALLAVLGPSGCGKTTLLRSIAGFIAIDAGSIRVDGRTVVDDSTWTPPERRRVGIVPQEGALFPHLRVGRNVAFGVPKSPERDAHVRHWLEIVGLGHLADARPHQLSGGQQQRVALARALAADPALVLLDEPFASLDAALRVAVRAEIAAVLRQTRRTAVLVTHDQHEALSTADQVAILLDGQVAQFGTPTEVYKTPATLDVARFVGDTVLLEGEVRGGRAISPLGHHDLSIAAAEGPVTVVLRPEQIAVDPTGEPVTLVASTYTGPDTTLHLRTDQGVHLNARVTGDALRTVGDTVTVRVRGSVLAYPRTAPPAGDCRG